MAGLWNHETSMDYLLRLDDMANRIRNRPWGLLADLRDWEFITQDGIIEGKEFNELKFSRKNQVAECWITDKQIYIKTLLRSSQLPEYVQFKAATDTREAIDFLTGLGLSLE